MIKTSMRKLTLLRRLMTTDYDRDTKKIKLRKKIFKMEGQSARWRSLKKITVEKIKAKKK